MNKAQLALAPTDDGPPRCVRCGSLIHLRTDSVRVSTSEARMVGAFGGDRRAAIRAIAEAMAEEVRPLDPCRWAVAMSHPLRGPFTFNHLEAVPVRSRVHVLVEGNERVFREGSIIAEPDPVKASFTPIGPSLPRDAEGNVVVGRPFTDEELARGRGEEGPHVKVGVDLGAEAPFPIVADVTTGEVV